MAIPPKLILFNVCFQLLVLSTASAEVSCVELFGPETKITQVAAQEADSISELQKAAAEDFGLFTNDYYGILGNLKSEASVERQLLINELSKNPKFKQPFNNHNISAADTLYYRILHAKLIQGEELPLDHDNSLNGYAFLQNRYQKSDSPVHFLESLAEHLGHVFFLIPEIKVWMQRDSLPSDIELKSLYGRLAQQGIKYLGRKDLNKSQRLQAINFMLRLFDGGRLPRHFSHAREAQNYLNNHDLITSEILGSVRKFFLKRQKKSLEEAIQKEMQDRTILDSNFDHWWRFTINIPGSSSRSFAKALHPDLGYRRLNWSPPAKDFVLPADRLTDRNPTYRTDSYATEIPVMGTHIAKNYDKYGKPLSMEILNFDGQQFQPTFYLWENQRWVKQESIRGEKVEQLCMRCHMGSGTGRIAKGQISPRAAFLRTEDDMLKVGFKDKELIRKFLDF